MNIMKKLPNLDEVLKVMSEIGIEADKEYLEMLEWDSYEEVDSEKRG